ncbi:hypothetical protein GCM10029992_52140 [Glycomyces albus]
MVDPPARDKNTKPPKRLRRESTVPIAPGQPALIAVAVATLWTSPTAPGPDDRLALGVPTAVRDWVARLTSDIRAHGLKGRIRTQVLLGTEVEVRKLEDGWAEVVCEDQDAAGWVPADQLTIPAEDDGAGSNTRSAPPPRPCATSPAGTS